MHQRICHCSTGNLSFTWVLTLGTKFVHQKYSLGNWAELNSFSVQSLSLGADSRGLMTNALFRLQQKKKGS
jgi:hypothetical protein